MDVRENLKWRQDEKMSCMTLVDLETGKTSQDIISEGRQELQKAILEIEAYMGINLLDVRFGFSRNKRLQQLCKLILGL